MPKNRPPRADYARFSTMTTRIRDNDLYRHMHNVTYYEFFDTMVNEWLLDHGGLTLPEGPVIGLVVETQCTYLAPLRWPGRVHVGMRVDRIGRTSLTYGLALFGEGEDAAAAVCRYVHVYVESAAHRPTPLPDGLREAARELLMASP